MTVSTSATPVYKSLHPTFVAEVSNVDLTKPTTELVDEIKRGLAKVSSAVLPSYSVREQG